MANQNLGNVMTRLGGLKNVSGRRVMPGAEFLQELEDVDDDVSGTAQPLPDFANFKIPDANLPQPDFGGELNSQSYDVRANSVMEPTQQQPELYSRFGKALGNYANPQKQEMSVLQKSFPQSPPIETAQVDIQEGLPPVTPSQEMAMQAPEMSPQQMEFPEASENVSKEKEPGTYVELGAAQSIYDNPETSPELKAEIERIFNTQLTPERNKEVKEFETVVDAFMNKLEGVETALSAREKQLLAKVENRDLSTSEQISMALALIAPAIVGGLIGGKEGLAGGLAAGGQNVAESLATREKELKEADELLPELALEKSNIAKEKLTATQQANELKRKIKESIPNHALRELFKKDGMLLNGKLVLDTGNPFLPLKSTAIRSEEDYKNFREKKMPQLSEKISTTEQGLHLLDNLQSLIDHSKSEKKGLQYDIIPWYDSLSDSYKALVPASRDTFTDEDGNVVKISEAYETILEQLSDMYSQSVGAIGSKTAFKSYREHFREMLPNPFTAESLAKGRTRSGTITAQIKSVKDKFEDNIVKKLDAAGVETSPVKKLFSETKINTDRSENKRKNNRANEAVKEVLGQ